MHSCLTRLRVGGEEMRDDLCATFLGVLAKPVPLFTLGEAKVENDGPARPQHLPAGCPDAPFASLYPLNRPIITGARRLIRPEKVRHPFID